MTDKHDNDYVQRSTSDSYERRHGYRKTFGVSVQTQRNDREKKREKEKKKKFKTKTCRKKKIQKQKTMSQG